MLQGAQPFFCIFHVRKLGLLNEKRTQDLLPIHIKCYKSKTYKLQMKYILGNRV